MAREQCHEQGEGDKTPIPSFNTVRPSMLRAMSSINIYAPKACFNSIWFWIVSRQLSSCVMSLNSDIEMFMSEVCSASTGDVASLPNLKICLKDTPAQKYQMMTTSSSD